MSANEEAETTTEQQQQAQSELLMQNMQQSLHRIHHELIPFTVFLVDYENSIKFGQITEARIESGSIMVYISTEKDGKQIEVDSESFRKLVDKPKGLKYPAIRYISKNSKIIALADLFGKDMVVGTAPLTFTEAKRPKKEVMPREEAVALIHKFCIKRNETKMKYSKTFQKQQKAQQSNQHKLKKLQSSSPTKDSQESLDSIGKPPKQKTQASTPSSIRSSRNRASRGSSKNSRLNGNDVLNEEEMDELLGNEDEDEENEEMDSEENEEDEDKKGVQTRSAAHLAAMAAAVAKSTFPPLSPNSNGNTVSKASTMAPTLHKRSFSKMEVDDSDEDEEEENSDDEEKAFVGDDEDEEDSDDEVIPLNPIVPKNSKIPTASIQLNPPKKLKTTTSDEILQSNIPSLSFPSNLHNSSVAAVGLGPAITLHPPVSASSMVDLASSLHHHTHSTSSSSITDFPTLATLPFLSFPQPPLLNSAASLAPTLSAPLLAAAAVAAAAAASSNSLKQDGKLVVKTNSDKKHQALLLPPSNLKAQLSQHHFLLSEPDEFSPYTSTDLLIASEEDSSDIDNPKPRKVSTNDETSTHTEHDQQLDSAATNTTTFERDGLTDFLSDDQSISTSSTSSVSPPTSEEEISIVHHGQHFGGSTEDALLSKNSSSIGKWAKWCQSTFHNSGKNGSNMDSIISSFASRLQSEEDAMKKSLQLEIDQLVEKKMRSLENKQQELLQQMVSQLLRTKSK